jgi:hypothetical protein
MHGPPRPAPEGAPPGTGRKLLLLAIPWVFLALLAYVAWHVVVLAMLGGVLFGYCLAPMFLLALVSFGAAAVTMSRDLLTGRYR